MESFLSHLATVYRAAQIISASDASAEKLVEEAYRRASAARRAGDTRPARQLLLAQLKSLNADLSYADADTVAEGAVGRARAVAAMERARSAVHQTLAGLEKDDWALLFLSEIDGLTPDELVAFVDADPEQLVARLQELHAEVHDHLLSESTPSVRASLLESLPEDWLRAALTEISGELPDPGDGLRSRIAASAGPQPRSERPPVPERGPVADARPKGPSREGRTKHSIRPLSVLIGVALILVIGFGADYLHSMLSQEPESDLIVLTARNAKDFVADLDTPSAERAERFLHTHSGLQVTIPAIENATLVAVGMEEIAPSVHAPAIRYMDDESGLPIIVYTISYRFLDDNPSVTLSSDIRRQIQSESNFDLHSTGAADVLVWRYRSNIFLAVTDTDARDIETRITSP
jgi:DNA-directed RNA polymerase specialized sigma24 family protein